MSNPLAGYFRVPGMHITLPSEGKFNDPSEFETSMNGELEVFPMTAQDELYTKNADALLNGSAVEKVIKSCVPGIKNVRSLPGGDVDYLLLCIKKVTYGDELKLGVECPKCKEKHQFVCSIEELLSNVDEFDDHYIVRINDEMVINLRPYDYESSTRLNIAAFEEARIFRAIVDIEITEDQRTKLFSDSFDKISRLNLHLLANCIISISVPNAVVTDKAHIQEFIRNANKNDIEAIANKMKEIGKGGLNKSVQITCPTETCGNEWTSDTIFDPSHFFE